MKKTISVDHTFNDMRIDRLLRNHLGKIPQGLIEKNLRIGNIKLNKKKVKSSTKVKLGDQIDLFNFNFQESIIQKKIKYRPSNDIIKENENLIIENNDDFIVLNKSSGISVQGGTKSKKNLIDIFAKSKIFENSKPFSVHRLDKDTSGVFIMAKNRETAQLLTSLFRLRKIHKTYLAICHGEFIKYKGLLKNNLIRFEAKKKIVESAETLFKVLDKNSKPYSVHRLDKDTSGVFIMAKNRETAQLLTSLFRLRKVHKTYLAICRGELDKINGTLKNDLPRYENKKQIIEKAETIFKVIDQNNTSTLVKMKPITGRKHQLRKHFFMIGHSILGDKKYNSQANIKSINKNLMLHSYEIKFIIKEKKYTFRASLPDYFNKMLKTKRLTFEY